MRKIIELEFGHNDASQYLNGKDKDLFNRLFLRTPELEKLLHTKTYFLIGEKGTGKTAFAVYLSNQNSKTYNAEIQVVGNTEYRRFIELKRDKRLQYSDYTAVWRVLLLLLVSQKLKSDISLLGRMASPLAFSRLCEAIDDFYNHAFTPEFEQAFEFVNRDEESLALVAKALEMKVGQSMESKSAGKRLILNLFQLEQGFKNALKQLKLGTQHILFIDGLDHRPPEIGYKDYMACLTGLLEASWDLNHEFFSAEKQLRNKLKIVILSRPDVLYKAGIHNVSSKLIDNSVILSWATDMMEYRESLSYRLIYHALEAQQENGTSPRNWFETYVKVGAREEDAFREILRLTWHRPRDYVTLLRILRDNRANGHTRGEPFFFSKKEIEDASFTKRFAQYLLQEARDYSMFYMDLERFDLLLTLFQGLNGRSTFSYNEFCLAYKNFARRAAGKERKVPCLASADAVLQYLYDMNVISYEEYASDGTTFFHWAYREKSTAELHPKIKFDCKYRIHPGIAKALDIGKALGKFSSGLKRNRSSKGRRGSNREKA